MAFETPARPPLVFTTKLLTPPISAGLITRPHLIARLRQALCGPLTMIAAPAGFGKTTLLIQALRTPETQLAWLSLDSADCDPSRFWSSVCLACERIAPGSSADAVSLLYSSQAVPLATVVAALINQLALLPYDGRPERRYVLVLDDYHLIETAAIHESLALLIERLPAQLHLVISTRADPPLPLARWRTRRQLTELRAADLRFTAEETHQLLSETIGLDLAPTVIAALAARTEGWVAGLHLAALALNGRPDPETFISAFAGSHRYVFDYLVDEVLARLPEQQYRFLLYTSILDQLCGELCDAIQQDNPAQMVDRSSALLAEIERAGLFLIPLDDQRRWYRYHHLFADVLRIRLHESAAHQEPELHRRASRWYEQQIALTGAPALQAAAHHALAAGDLERAARLIDHSAETLWRQGNPAQLLALIRLLPEAAIYAHPRLSILLARALVISGDLERVAPLLEATNNVLDQLPASTSDHDQLRGWVLAIESHLRRLHEDILGAIAYAKQALDLLPSDDPASRGFVMLGLAMARHISDALPVAVQVYEQAATLLAAADDRAMEAMACYLSGWAWIALGQLGQATRAFERTLQRCGWNRARNTAAIPIAGMALIGLAELAYQRNNLGEAERLVRLGLGLAEQGGIRDALLVGNELLVRIQIGLEQADAAEQTALRLIRLADENHMPAIMGWSRAILARVQLAQGRMAEALAWLATYQPWAGRLTPIRADEFLVFLRVLLAADRPFEALTWIGHQLPVLEAVEYQELILQCLTLQARAYALHQQTDAAYIAITQALELSLASGVLRPFLDGGWPMQQLLVAYRTHASSTPGQPGLAQTTQLLAHVDLLIGMFPAKPNLLTSAIQHIEQPAINLPERALLEPLTAREYEILQLVAAGHSNQEIAELLIVSVGTIKTHLHNLYGKLNARDRTHAVAQARTLGILS